MCPYMADVRNRTVSEHYANIRAVFRKGQNRGVREPPFRTITFGWESSIQ